MVLYFKIKSIQTNLTLGGTLPSTIYASNVRYFVFLDENLSNQIKKPLL